MAVWRAREDGVKNFSILVSHVLRTSGHRSHPSVAAESRPGFLDRDTSVRSWAITIRSDQRSLSGPYRRHGFEPLDILDGTLMTVRQLEAGRAEVENQYARAVEREGNRAAQTLVSEVFEICDRKWRGVGSISKSGFRLRYEFRDHDAEQLFEVAEIDTKSPQSVSAGKS